jgi:copper(I)-binding protein
MSLFRISIALAAAVLISCKGPGKDSQADPSQATGLELTAPFAYPFKSGEPVGVTYLNITNHGPEDDRLVSAHTAVATRVETHETVEEDGVVRMLHRQGGFALPAGATLTMEPGGHHLMLMDLKADLVEGHPYELTLEFEKAGTMAVQVPVGLDIDQR